MGTKEKRLQRLYGTPKDSSLAEAEALLIGFGFHRINKGKTSGSRAAFLRAKDRKIFLLHLPHKHGNILDIGAVKDLAEFVKRLEEEGDLNV